MSKRNKKSAVGKLRKNKTETKDPRAHDTTADAREILVHVRDGLGIRETAREIGWSYRRTRGAWHEAAEMLTTGVEAEPTADEDEEFEIRQRAADDELTVEWSNWLQHPPAETRWVREASVREDLFRIDENGNEVFDGVRVDPGTLWPEDWDGPKTLAECGIDEDAPVARPAKFRAILLAAQNKTPLHGPAYLNICVLAHHMSAHFSVGGVVYGKGLFEGRKKGEALEIDPWSDDIAGYVTRDRLNLPGEVQWAAEMNITPTAVNPLTGLHTYCGGKTTIFPHTKRALESLPRNKSQTPIFAWTTGSITVPNYILRKAGLRALQTHCIGGLLLEVADDGTVFIHELNADPATGDIWLFDTVYTRGRVRHAEDVIAEQGLSRPVLGLGCLHERHMNADFKHAVWGLSNDNKKRYRKDLPLIDIVRPSTQVFNDLLDSGSIIHHDRNNPWKKVEKHFRGTNNIAEEVRDAADFIEASSRPECDTRVIYSNHDDAYPRWLRDTDWREDPVNARFYLKSNLAMVEALEEGRTFDVFDWALREANDNARFQLVTVDEIFQPIRHHYEYHGDKSPNGARGSTVGLSKLGVPIIKAHDHQMTIREETRSTGNGIDSPPYAVGPTSWARGVTIEHPNGQAQSVIFWGDRYRA